jgi:TP901-1 family phage major tail protein
LIEDPDMAIQKGRDLLVKVADGAGGFATVAGLRSRRLAFNSEAVDVTHSESAGRWRELLAGAGVRKASVAGAGVFRDAASDALIRGLVFSSEIAEFQIVIPDFGRIEGPFQVTALEFRGDHAGEVGFDLALESAGELAFTAI